MTKLLVRVPIRADLVEDEGRSLVEWDVRRAMEKKASPLGLTVGAIRLESIEEGAKIDVYTFSAEVPGYVPVAS